MILHLLILILGTLVLAYRGVYIPIITSSYSPQQRRISSHKNYISRLIPIYIEYAPYPSQTSSLQLPVSAHTAPYTASPSSRPAPHFPTSPDSRRSSNEIAGFGQSVGGNYRAREARTRKQTAAHCSRGWHRSRRTDVFWRREQPVMTGY